MSKNPALDAFMRGQGILAEASLVFYRDLIGAGATADEATRLTQAYIAALVHGSQKEGEAK